MNEPDIAANVRKRDPTHADLVGIELLNNRTDPSCLTSLPGEAYSDDSGATFQADAIPDELKKPKPRVMGQKETRPAHDRRLEANTGD